MVPTSWRVREGGGAMALMPWYYAARHGLVRLVGRLPVGMGALSDTAALGDRGMSVLQRSCSASDEGRWCLPAGGGAMALKPWCYAARHGLVRLVRRLPVGTGALSDTAALGDGRTSVLQRSCSASDEGRW